MSSPEQIVPEPLRADLEFLKNDADWPLWPYLPMKRIGYSSKGRQEMRYGVLAVLDHQNGKRYIWYPDVNLFDVKPGDLRIGEGTVFLESELWQLTESGWLVD